MQNPTDFTLILKVICLKCYKTNHRARVKNLFFILVTFVVIRFRFKYVVHKNLQNFLEIYHKKIIRCAVRTYGIDGAMVHIRCAMQKCEVRNRAPDGAEVRNRQAGAGAHH